MISTSYVEHTRWVTVSNVLALGGKEGEVREGGAARKRDKKVDVKGEFIEGLLLSHGYNMENEDFKLEKRCEKNQKHYLKEETQDNSYFNFVNV